MQPANPVNPQRVTWELSPRLPDGVILTSDSGSCANWYARDLKIRRGMMASLSGGLASMGAAVPYAIAAKFAHPDRPVIALVGDGAMQMNNMAELITVAKYWQHGPTRAGSSACSTTRISTRSPGSSGCMEGDPKFDASQQIPNVPYHKFAELIGLKGIYVDDPEQLGAAWDEALAADRPVVLEVKTDPEVPPLPPHITPEGGQELHRVLLKGDPRERQHHEGDGEAGSGSVLPGNEEVDRCGSDAPISSACGRAPTRSRPTGPRRTAPSPGTRPRCRGRRRGRRRDGTWLHLRRRMRSFR